MHKYRNTGRALFGRLAGLLCLAGLWIMPLSGADTPATPRVGLYPSPGATGMRAGLTAAGIQAEMLADLEEDTLFGYDVIILGSVKGFPRRHWEDSLTLFAQAGGGVLLNHDATGFRGWQTPLFPDLFQGTAQERDRRVATVDDDHPLTDNLPETFEHGYFDHIALAAGPDGTAVLKNAAGQPLAVYGPAGAGRVVGTGMVIGLAEIRGAGQGEQAPADAELQFLLNAVRWLAEQPLTALAPEERTARRRALHDARTLREAARVAVDEEVAGHGDPRRDWFSPTMLNEQGFVHPPIEILPGRFFMFEGITVSVVARQHTGRSYGEIIGILRQLKWLGVTDIITHSGGPLANIRYLSELPGIRYSPRARSYGFDYLKVLLDAAHEVGLNVWGFWHPNTRGDVGAYQIRDPRGEAYAQYLDIKNPDVLALARACIDELVDRYNVHGNFKGIFLDELWHPFVYDRMEGETERFAAFCHERFGEAPPEDMDLAALFARGRDWHDPEDVWWRRYVLFRNTFAVDYIRAVTEYANSRGLQIMPQIGFGFHWFQGHGDTYNLARAGNILWSYELRNNTRYEQYPHDRVIFATHSRFPNGYQLACLLRGGWGSQFALEQTWLPVTWSYNPRAPEVLARQIRTNRQWFGAKPLTRQAVLTHRLGLDLRFRNAAAVFQANEESVQRILGTRWPTALLMTQDTDYYDHYKILVAPRHSLEFIAEREYEALVRYVDQGGTLLLLNGRVITARPDHTQEHDRTREFTGFERTSAEPVLQQAGALRFTDQPASEDDPAFAALALSSITADPERVRVLAATEDGEVPVVTETRRGQGRILAVHGDLAAWLNAPENMDAALALVQRLVKYVDDPPVRLSGDLLVFSAVQKDNWVAVSLLSSDATYTARGGENYPARGTLYVDMPALGVQADRYRVYTLARDREMMPQTETDLNLWGQTYWSAERLARQGIPIYIPPNSLQDLELPYEGDDEYIRRYILTRWGNAPRRTEHEIIAIAPADEGSMVRP